jgi:hypothetical protein
VLRAPTSFSVRREIWASGGRNIQRAFCAALGACWGAESMGRPAARYNFDPLEYGGKVLDELVAAGVNPDHVLAVGAIAYELLSEGVYRDEEVVAALGNSGAPPDGAASTG